MGCEEVLARLWEYLDQELEPTEANDVRLHLTGCPQCRPVYRCDLAFLELLARQRTRCPAPARLVMNVRFLLSTAGN